MLGNQEKKDQEIEYVFLLTKVLDDNFLNKFLAFARFVAFDGTFEELQCEQVQQELEQVDEDGKVIKSPQAGKFLGFFD